LKYKKILFFSKEAVDGDEKKSKKQHERGFLIRPK
jgi:hypothetical protein